MSTEYVSCGRPVVENMEELPCHLHYSHTKFKCTQLLLSSFHIHKYENIFQKVERCRDGSGKNHINYRCRDESLQEKQVLQRLHK